MAACIFDDPSEITKAADLMDDFALSKRFTKEFKYHTTKKRLKNELFEEIASVSFRVRAIVINKSQLHSEILTQSPSALKSYAIRLLLTKNWGQISNAKVFIDGNDTKGFGMNDDKYLEIVNRDSPGTITEIRHVDSKTSRPIQLADMVAGAINKAFRTDVSTSTKHFDTFKHRTYQPGGTVWHFK